MPADSPGIRVLCPRRWTVRAQALQSILANYEVLQLLWEESLDFVKDTEMNRIQKLKVRKLHDVVRCFLWNITGGAAA